MIHQLILSREQQQRVADGNTVFLFDNNGNCVVVLLGYREQDGVGASDILAAERREAERSCL